MEVAPESRLDLAGWLLAAVGASLDAGVLRAARALIDRTVMPDPEGLTALRASAAFYLRPELASAPRRFFAFLDAPMMVPSVMLAPLSAHGCGARRFALTFASAYEPCDPGMRRPLLDDVENRIVHAQLWLHPGTAPRPTAVALHGFGMGYPAFDATALMAPTLFRMGLDVVLFTLPFHGARTPARAYFSGQLFVAPHVARINEAIGQAVHDLARLLAWHRASRGTPVGLVGHSLGGYVAALMAGLVHTLDFVIPISAPVCLGDLAWRFMRASRRYRADQAAVLPREELQAAYRVHGPLTYPRRVARERLLIVAGAGDQVVPPAHATWLWSHWDEPRLHCTAGSHVAPFGRAGIGTAIRGLLGDLGLAPA